MKKSTLIPCLLLVYLAIMSYIGRHELQAGNYTFYFSTIAITLLCIVLLHFTLKRRENKNKN